MTSFKSQFLSLSSPLMDCQSTCQTIPQEPVLFASSIRHNIMQGFPDATKEDFQKARKEKPSRRLSWSKWG